MALIDITGQTRLEDLPLIGVNRDNMSVVSMDAKGLLYKVPIRELGTYVGLSYSSLLEEGEDKIILGRYSEGEGNVQKIKLGDNLDINIDTGMLEARLEVVGEAGGDFEGSFPSPQIKPQAVTLDKIQEIPGNTLLGRSEEGVGDVGIVYIGPEFRIEQGVLEVTVGTDNIVSTGWVVANREKDFVCSPNNMYFVNSLPAESVYATIPTGWNEGEQVIVVNKGGGNVIIVTPTDFIDFSSNEVRSLNLVSDGEDNYFIV